MAINVGQVDRSKLAALYGYNANAVSAAGNQNANSVSATGQIDVNAITSLAKKNAGANVGAVDTVKNPTQAVSAVQQTEPATTAKVDAKTVTGIFGQQGQMPNANKYTGMAASSTYANVSSKNGTGYGVYDGLKNFKSSGAVANNSNNQDMFSNIKTNNANTAGLSFGGLTNINPSKNMFIA